MKVLLSGGGTGGHVYPAIAIANKIKEENPDAEMPEFNVISEEYGELKLADMILK